MILLNIEGLIVGGQHVWYDWRSDARGKEAGHEQLKGDRAQP